MFRERHLLYFHINLGFNPAILVCVQLAITLYRIEFKNRDNSCALDPKGAGASHANEANAFLQLSVGP